MDKISWKRTVKDWSKEIRKNNFLNSVLNLFSIQYIKLLYYNEVLEEAFAKTPTENQLDICIKILQMITMSVPKDACTTYPDRKIEISDSVVIQQYQWNSGFQLVNELPEPWLIRNPEINVIF